MARNYAGILGCLAMSIALIRGTWLGTNASPVIAGALVALVAFALLGFTLGYIAEVTLVETVRVKLERELEANGKSNRHSAAARAA